MVRRRSCNGADLVDLGACQPFYSKFGAIASDPGRLFRWNTCLLAQRHPIPDESALIEMYRGMLADDILYDGMDADDQRSLAWND